MPHQIRTYVLVYLALLALMAATVAIAFVNLGVLNPVVALSVAVVKAVLIMLFFMHLRESPRVVWVYAIAGFFWLLILLVLTMADFLTRA
jgi:cytochrome c oxidase subunit IV